jgi:hypothetical protein
MAAWGVERLTSLSIKDAISTALHQNSWSIECPQQEETMIDPSLSLAFSAQGNPGVYALLIAESGQALQINHALLFQVRRAVHGMIRNNENLKEHVTL